MSNSVFTPAQVIAKKRDGGTLSADEIQHFITGYVDGSVPDYQMAALAMAIYLRGMDTVETAALAECMLRSGEVLEWSSPVPPKVDKHSTGGIGDKTSLVLAPLLACCGLQVPMISGRGLGATGGTLDKLESIPGFRTHLSRDEIQRITEQVGCVITGATSDLVPADRKLYALRDVTATVASIPLITASIMSKKLAEGLSALVLDVKFGSGAFMTSLDQARLLAHSLVATGERMGVQTTALLTDMNQPLGRMVGNAVEVDESIAALRGDGPDDLMEVALALGAELLVSVGIDTSVPRAVHRLQGYIDSGDGLEKFREMVGAQGGDINAPRPISPTHNIPAQHDGFVTHIDTATLGLAVIELGGGRKKITDTLDLSTGLEMLVRIGDRVEQGWPLARVFTKLPAAHHVQPLIQRAITITDRQSAQAPLIVERVEVSRE
jgi:pyrimidine-nucleoside phosphorylase